MNAIHLIVAALATWRLTHLLASEDGPADIIVKFRALLGTTLAGQLMDCFYCLSLWIAAPAALLITHHFADWLLVSLAFSGAACLLERTQPSPSQGENHHVLWSETNEPENRFDDTIQGIHTIHSASRSPKKRSGDHLNLYVANPPLP